MLPDARRSFRVDSDRMEELGEPGAIMKLNFTIETIMQGDTVESMTGQHDATSIVRVERGWSR